MIFPFFERKYFADVNSRINWGGIGICGDRPLSDSNQSDGAAQECLRIPARQGELWTRAGQRGGEASLPGPRGPPAWGVPDPRGKMARCGPAACVKPQEGERELQVVFWEWLASSLAGGWAHVMAVDVETGGLGQRSPSLWTDGPVLGSSVCHSGPCTQVASSRLFPPPQSGRGGVHRRS